MGTADPKARDATLPDESPPRDRFVRWLLIVGAIWVIALVGLRLWWGHEARRQLDRRLDACRAAGQPVAMSDLACEPVPDKENAAHYFNQATAGLTSSPGRVVDVQRLSANPDACRFFADEVDAYLAENAAALDLVHQACQCERVDWQVQFVSPGINVLLPHLSGQRALAKLTSLAALRAHQRGDDHAALQHVEDILATARFTDLDGPFLMIHMIRVAIETTAIGTIGGLLPTLSIVSDQPATPGSRPAERKQIESLIANLLDEGDYIADLNQAILGERVMMLDFLFSFASRPTTAIGAGSAPGVLETAFVALFEPAWLLDGARMCDSFAHIADAVYCSEWPAARDRISTYDYHPGGIFERLSRLFSNVMMPSFERAVEIHYRIRAQRRMAALALALRLYRHDHGQWPETLAALVPDYLPNLPTDPFDPAGGPIGYLPDADPPRLYSRNSDGIDQQGTSERYSGGVKRDSLDLPFFLDDDSEPVDPRDYLLPGAEWPPASQPAEVTDAAEATDDIEPFRANVGSN